MRFPGANLPLATDCVSAPKIPADRFWSQLLLTCQIYGGCKPLAQGIA